MAEWTPKGAVPVQDWVPPGSAPIEAVPQTAFGSIGPAALASPGMKLARGIHDQLPVLAAIIAQGTNPEAPGLALALGGAGGRALQQMTAPLVGREPPANPLQAFGEQAQSGATQVVLGQGPERAAQAIKPAAEWLMQTAIGKYGSQGLRAAKTALQERAGPGFRGRQVRQVTGLIDAVRERVNTMLGAAKAKGNWHDPRELAKAGDELLSDPALTDAEKSRVAAWADELVQGKVIRGPSGTEQVKVNPVDPVSLNRIRQRYDAEAQDIHRALSENQYVPPAERLRAQWAKATADKARQMLQDTQIYPNAVPGLDEAQGHLSGLINLKQTLVPGAKKAFGRALPYAPGIGAGTIGAALPANTWHERILHGVAAGAIASPPGMSNLALLLSQPGGAQMLSTLLRGSAAAADVTQQRIPQP